MMRRERLITYRRLAKTETSYGITTQDVAQALDGDEQAGKKLLNFLKGFLKKIAYHTRLERTTHEELYEYLYDWVMAAIFPERMKEGKPSRFDPTRGTKFISWLYSVVNNAIADYMTRVEKRKPISLSEPTTKDSEDGFTVEDLLGAEPDYYELVKFKDTISEIKQDLDPRARKTLDMLMEGYKKKEIAEELNISPGYVTSFVKQIKDVIRGRQKHDQPVSTAA